MDELAQVTQRQKAMWGAGDYDPFAAMLRPASAPLVEAVGVGPGDEVVDVACGSGNTSLAAVRAGARVTGVDITPRMLEMAIHAAAREGVSITWLEGDAQALPLADSSFDVALSTFGVMFAPDQERAAWELVRVVRPDGRIGVTAWTDEGGPGSFLRVVGSFSPPPPAGAGNPLAWGDEGHVRELFAAVAPKAEVSVSRRDVPIDFDSVEDAVTTYTTRFGPLVQGRPGYEEAGTWEPLVAALGEFFEDAPRSAEGRVVMTSDYLQTVVRLPG